MQTQDCFCLTTHMHQEIDFSMWENVLYIEVYDAQILYDVCMKFYSDVLNYVIYIHMSMYNIILHICVYIVYYK